MDKRPQNLLVRVYQFGPGGGRVQAILQTQISAVAGNLFASIPADNIGRYLMMQIALSVDIHLLIAYINIR